MASIRPLYGSFGLRDLTCVYWTDSSSVYCSWLVDAEIQTGQTTHKQRPSSFWSGLPLKHGLTVACRSISTSEEDFSRESFFHLVHTSEMYVLSGIVADTYPARETQQGGSIFFDPCTLPRMHDRGEFKARFWASKEESWMLVKIEGRWISTATW